MTRSQLEHIIRAAASISEDDEIYVFGSQSILGAFPNPPQELTVSMEADVAPKNKPKLEILIEGSIGELSPSSIIHPTDSGRPADGERKKSVVVLNPWGDLMPLEKMVTRRGFAPRTPGCRPGVMRFHHRARGDGVMGEWGNGAMEIAVQNFGTPTHQYPNNPTPHSAIWWTRR